MALKTGRNCLTGQSTKTIPVDEYARLKAAEKELTQLKARLQKLADRLERPIK